MSNFWGKMQQKFGKYAIRNLPLILTILYGFGYVMETVIGQRGGAWSELLSLNFYAIFHYGQVWRLISWILIPEPMNIFFVLIMLYFYYSLGRTLERTMGSFLFDVYVFGGMILSVVGALLLYVALTLISGDYIAAFDASYINAYGELPVMYGGSYFWTQIAGEFGVYYINLSIFLAFAILYPDVKVYVFFVLPIKCKVLGIIYVAVLGFNIVLRFFGGPLSGLIALVSIGTSLLNTLIFFLWVKRLPRRTPKQVKRQVEYKAKIKAAEAKSRVHKCEICGQTSAGNPSLSFRFCSKCNGVHEYCETHIFTHEHIQ